MFEKIFLIKMDKRIAQIVLFMLGEKGATHEKPIHVNDMDFESTVLKSSTPIVVSNGDDTSQLGGDFIVDKNGVLRLIHPSHGPADRPSVEEPLKTREQL